MAETYDPADYTVEEVNEYLSSIDQADRQAVIDAEAAGKARVGILQGPQVANDKPDDDGPEERAPFVQAADGVAADVQQFVLDTQKRLDELVQAHDDAKAASLGDPAHREVTYALQRVASTFEDLNRALTAAGSVASALAGEVAAVEG